MTQGFFFILSAEELISDVIFLWRRILQQCQPRYETGSGYGGEAAFAQDLLIRVGGL